MEAYLADVWGWAPSAYEGMSISQLMGYYRRAAAQQDAKAEAYRKGAK